MVAHSREFWAIRLKNCIFSTSVPDLSLNGLPLVRFEVVYSWNLTQIDETDSRFIKHLRERRHLWVQGVKVKTMAKFDDDRYGAEKQIWEQMLAQYAAQNVVYSQMEGYR